MNTDLPADREVVQCDIIVPVYNGLTYVRDCIDSILTYSAPVNYRLYLVDDGSDSHTHSYLEGIAGEHSHVSCHRNADNVGFIESCNRGIACGGAPYVVLVNSDVVVTPNWLQRLLDCANSDPGIGSVNPLTR